MNKKIIIFGLFFIPFNIFGQITPVSDQYVLNPLLINPSYSGSRNALSIGTFYRRQWVGIDGAPESVTITVDAPLMKDRLGLGFIMISDKIGVTDEMQLVSNYAFRIPVGKGKLALGLGGGMIITNTAWSQLFALEPGDDYYLIDSRPFVVPAFSVGSYYSVGNFYAGFSIPKILSYKFDFNKNKYKLINDTKNYTYLLNTAYIIKISDHFRLMPSALVSYSQSTGINFDINTYSNIYDKVWLGVSYRDQRAVTALLQFQISEQFKVAYSYDYDLGKLGRFSNGSHGIMLRYEMRYRVDAVGPLLF